MKGEARLLLDKAADSLLVGIEKFNCPFEPGRITAVLIFLDHAFEMLLKASILQRGGRIRKKGAPETIGFDACVRVGLSDGKIKFLTEEQALTLQMLNGLRDAAQHHLITIQETQLYIHAQSAVTLFRDLLKSVFRQELMDYLPQRVLPISTQPPVDLSALFDSETAEIRRLLNRRRKAQIEIDARLRPLAIVDATIRGRKTQPSKNELHKLEKQLKRKRNWNVVLVPEGTPGASVVAVKRVDELSFYSLGAKELAAHVGVTINKVVAAVRVLKIDQDPNCFKEVAVGRIKFKRYSQQAIARIKEALRKRTIDEIWREYQRGIRKR